MTAKTKRQGGIPFTGNDARLFQDVFDVLEAVYGEEAPSYMRGYLETWTRYRQLKATGVKVSISPPKYGRRWSLLNDEGRAMDDDVSCNQMIRRACEIMVGIKSV